MSIIVSKNGKNAQKLDKISFGLEDKLQQYIYDNPESIPLYDIKEDIQLLILAREFQTNSGPIDAIGIDQDGQLYLVETKLYKNPDKRTVIAQVIDYGASLWKTLNDFDDFLLQLNSHVQKKFGISTTEKIQEYFSLDDDQMNAVLEQMKYNLDEGNFKFVVMMDSLENRLKDLIVYMNQNSKFDIYGVELEYYQHDTFEIMIPKIYGAEVKKDVSTRKAVSAIPLSDEEFLKAFNTNYQPVIRELLVLSQEIQNGKLNIAGLKSKKTARNLYFYFQRRNDQKPVLTLEIGVFGGKPSEALSFHTTNEAEHKDILEIISKHLGIKVTDINPSKKFGLIAKWNLDDVDINRLIQLFEKLVEFSK